MTAQELAAEMHKFGIITFNRWAIDGAAMLIQQAEQIETERMKLVACGVVAMADTPDSARIAREMHTDYRSASLDDVIRRVVSAWLCGVRFKRSRLMRSGIGGLKITVHMPTQCSQILQPNVGLNFNGSNVVMRSGIGILTQPLTMKFHAQQSTQ